ncbi:hypothetical protein B0H14DRAFT_2645478 [Mycena olivaceomarginata]|nr:hypothetical protein B0H14DRAFT_2645478 [Mycena olivaceomarginata]
MAIWREITAILEDGVKNTMLVAGVQWSQRGNLVLLPAMDACTASFLLDQSHLIWTALRPLLRLPENYERPLFETDEPWHSVIFHGVPMSPGHSVDSYDREFIKEALQISGASHGVLRGHSLLWCPADLQTKSSIALQISLSSEVDASHLICNGRFIAGTWCRVSPYVGRHLEPSSLPAPIPHQ